MSHFNKFFTELIMKGNLLKTLFYSGIIYSAATLFGCSFNLPQLGGATGRNNSIVAISKVAEFDKPSPAMQDLSQTRGREYAFVLNQVRKNGEDCLLALNRREAPVSVQIQMIAEENLSSDRSFPFNYVIPPNTDVCIARLFPMDKKKEYRYRYNKIWMVGDYTARHNPLNGYRLPWPKGEAHVVVQASGGPITTHTDSFSRNAIDFSLPLGTPVLAARSGRVVNVEDSFNIGGADRALVDKSNFVDVLHEDGTIATYAHLAEKSVTVGLGQTVAVGDKLGLSGSTGYSSGPHLHFSVWRLENNWKGFERVSIPVEFCLDNNSPCIALQYGMNVSHSSVLGEGEERQEKGIVAGCDPDFKSDPYRRQNR